MRAPVIAVICSAAIACKGRDPAPPPAPAPRAPARTADRSCALAEVPARRPAPARLVAIGDLHGDAHAARAALRLAGAIDDRDRWIGGALVVVQLGDVLDRGDGEKDILDLFARLELDARAAGGALIPLLGNHELMNAAGDFRYVTSGGFAEFIDAAGVMDSHADVAAIPPDERARAAALFPGGPYAHRLAGHLVIAIVGDTVFVHGGLSPQWATRIDDVNRSARCWLDGAGPQPDVLTADDGPVWSRAYAGDRVDCDEVARALAAVGPVETTGPDGSVTRGGAKRMVIAHTVQPNGISSACDGAVWRIDVGLAALYGGPLQALEIDHDERGDRVQALGAKP